MKVSAYNLQKRAIVRKPKNPDLHLKLNSRTQIMTFHDGIRGIFLAWYSSVMLNRGRSSSQTLDPVNGLFSSEVEILPFEYWCH